MIRFACPGCQATFSVDDSKAGKSGKCPKCQSQFYIPQPEGAVPGAPALSATNIPLSVPAPQPTVVDPNLPVEIDPCPKCQTKLSVATSDLGNDVECPYCKTVFPSTKIGSRAVAPPPLPPEKKSSFDNDFSSRPKPRITEDRDDDRPRRRRNDDDDENDAPRRSSRRDDDSDDDDDRPSRRGRGSKRAEAADDDDRPSRRRSSRRDDDDYDDDDSPRSRRSSRNRRRGSGQRSGAVTAVGVLTILLSLLWFILTGFMFFATAVIGSFLNGLPRNQMNPNGQPDIQAAVAGLAICCGLPLLLVAVFHLLGGIFTLQRKSAGRIITIICAVLAIIGGLLQLFGLIAALTRPAVATEAFLGNLFSTSILLGYGIFTMIVLCRSDYAEEFS
jgi:predicted Zn finger-like uncharacterized protein